MQHCLWERYAEKSPGFDKDKTDVTFGDDSVWLCIFHFLLCTSQGIKVPLKIKWWTRTSFHESLVPPCLSVFFSLTLFFRLIPWSIEALCIHLSAWASKTRTGRRTASSLPWETGRAPAAYVKGASSLSWGFIGFLCKQRNISLYSLPLSLSLSPTPSTLQLPWIQLGLDPGTNVHCSTSYNN